MPCWLLQELKKQTVGLERLEEGMYEHKDRVVQANVRLKEANAKVSMAEPRAGPGVEAGRG